MPRLVLATTDGRRVALELRPGVNRLGRDPGNDFPIDDPSVSSSHAEIAVEPGQVSVRDLQSTNGTFLDGEPVQEALLRPGQVLQLGAVALSYEAPEEEREVSVDLQAPLPAAVGVPCRNHPATEAEFRCRQCRNAYCPACVTTRQASGRHWQLCPLCKGQCVSLAAAAPPPALSSRPATFAASVPGAFAFPFAGGGALYLAIGTMVFALINFAKAVAHFAGGLGFVSLLILTVFGLGYLFGYMQQVISASVRGEDRPPGLPEIADWGSDLVRPCLMLVALGAVSFAPALAYWMLAKEMSPGVLLPLLALGMVYFPMALLAVAISDDFISLSPLVVLPAIARIPGPYAVACLVLAGLAGLRWVCGRVLDLLPIPLLPGLAMGFIGFYFVTVQMRVLGLMYYFTQARIGWYR